MEEKRQRPSRRPSRRTVLIAGAAAAGGAATGSILTRTLRQPRLESPSVPAPDTSPPEPDQLWEERDQRFLEELSPAADELPVLKEFRGAFPALKIRDILPLKGMGSEDAPWIAATVIGPANQLQITRSGEESPHYVLDIPAERSGEILSMAWDPSLRTLYLSVAGRLWAWRYSHPTRLVQLANVPGASVLYELLVDPEGVVWGGTFPLGAVFRYDPGSKKIHIFSRLSEGSQYVRRLTMDSHGRLWAGTGSRNPRIFSFLRTSPEVREEIALPEPLETGFITAVRAGTSRVLITTDGHPDIFELDASTLTWGRKFDASGWVRPPSANIMRNDTYYTVENSKLIAHEPSTSAPVARVSIADATSLHVTGTDVILAGPRDGGLSLERVSPTLHRSSGVNAVTLEPGRFKVQSVLAPSDGNVYAGGYMSTGVAGIDPDTDERWHSPSDVDVIHQIENMVEFDPDRIYLGTYSWADIISWDVSSRDDASRYERVVRLYSPYEQSRPFGLATNSTSLFVGTVPDYGLSGGVLAKIDVATNTAAWVLDGGGAGFVENHSIIGLVANEDYVFGTTSVRNGYGIPDTEGPAHVFMFDIETRKKVWQTEPVPSAGALYSPMLVAGWLLVADVEGINVIDPRNGRLEARHRLGPDENSSHRAGWASAEIAAVGDGRRIVHCAAGAISVTDFLSATSARVQDDSPEGRFGTRITASPSGRVFAVSQGTDIVEISAGHDT